MQKKVTLPKNLETFIKKSIKHHLGATYKVVKVTDILPTEVDITIQDNDLGYNLDLTLQEFKELFLGTLSKYFVDWDYLVYDFDLLRTVKSTSPYTIQFTLKRETYFS